MRMIPDRLWHEATVGAGMPIISTIGGLLETGDEILEIQASPSGTLGFIMSAVEGGRSFSEAVREAVDLHYAEPDPRDDLSGLDVARKAIILARMMGREIEPDEIPYESLVPEAWKTSRWRNSWQRLPEHDEAFAARLLAVEEHHMLRYLVRIPKSGPVNGRAAGYAGGEPLRTHKRPRKRLRFPHAPLLGCYPHRARSGRRTATHSERRGVGPAGYRAQGFVGVRLRVSGSFYWRILWVMGIR